MKIELTQMELAVLQLACRNEYKHTFTEYIENTLTEDISEKQEKAYNAVLDALTSVNEKLHNAKI